MLISATWGLGSALAQGEVVPDRIALDRNGRVLSIDPGRKPQRDQCVHGLGLGPRAVPTTLACEASIAVDVAEALGAMLLKAERMLRRTGRDRVGAGRAWPKASAGATAARRARARARSDLASAPGAARPSRRNRLGRRAQRRRALRMRARARRDGRRPRHPGGRACAEPGVGASGGRRHRARRLDVAPCFARPRARHTDGARRARRDAQDSRRRAGRRRRRRGHRSVDELMGRPSRSAVATLPRACGGFPP